MYFLYQRRYRRKNCKLYFELQSILLWNLINIWIRRIRLYSNVYEHLAFLRVFFKRTCILCRSSYIFWLDRKYSRWNCGNIWTNTVIFIYKDNVVDNFYLLFYCHHQKFNLTGGFLIFLFMMTGREIIFICSTEPILSLWSNG